MDFRRNPRSRPHESGSTLARSLLGDTSRLRTIFAFFAHEENVPVSSAADCSVRNTTRVAFVPLLLQRYRKLQRATRIVSSNEIPYARFTRKKRNRPINFITFDRHRIYPIPLIGNSHRRKISPRNRRPDELFPSIERGQNTISFLGIRGII